MITLNHYLIVSGILFALGLAGVVARRNILIIYMCLEMMLSAATSTISVSNMNMTLRSMMSA